MWSKKLRTKVGVHQTTDMVWCATLYGGGAGVMRHVKACLLLGYVWRYELSHGWKRKECDSRASSLSQRAS